MASSSATEATAMSVPKASPTSEGRVPPYVYSEGGMGQEAEKGGDRERRACSAKVAGGGRLGIARGAPSASRTISRTPANGSSPGSAALGGCCCGCCLRVRSAANCAASSSPESCCCISALRDGLRHAGRCTSAGSTAIIDSGVDGTVGGEFAASASLPRLCRRPPRISFHPHRSND